MPRSLDDSINNTFKHCIVIASAAIKDSHSDCFLHDLGLVSIEVADGSKKEFNVKGGFLSVNNDRVSILTESVA